jgi:Fe-Mn family superoxide dismutase
MPFELPPLPYAQDALEPHYTARTLSFHYGKHHQTYVDTLNKLVDGTDLAGKELEEVISDVRGVPEKQAVFNNAAQVWNHTFFWNSMTSGGGGEPSGELAERLTAGFGSVEQAIEAMKTAGLTRFGSGWTWLVADKGELVVLSTANAEQPATGTPLLVVDVWEHAYYLDYQNLRALYLKTFFESLVNWNFAAANLAAAE